MSTQRYQAIRALQALDEARELDRLTQLTEVLCADGSTEWVDEEELEAASDVLDSIFLKRQAG
jgi:hypothetical protein